MKKLIIANWKNHPNSLREAKRIFSEVKKTAVKLKKVETIICPPYVYLAEFGRATSDKMRLGSQDISLQEKGSHTGEISVAMLKSLGVKYVIVGHSERRALGETNEIINQKIKILLKNNLKVILCIGETERIPGEYLQFIKQEIIEGFKGIPRKALKNVIIAYEPIWAIGKKGSYAAAPEDVLQMGIYIRKSLLDVAGKDLAHNIPLLYGASVDSKNTEKFFREGGIQGLLVGHQSLVPKEFNKILKVAEGL